MEIKSESRYSRISPKKVREMGRVICGLSTTEAITRLMFVPGKAGKLLAKVIKAASANATNNHKLDVSRLSISSVWIGKGPAFKRFQPVSRGIAHPYKRRTSHITVVLKQVEKVEKAEKVEKENKVPREGKINKARDTRDSRGTS